MLLLQSCGLVTLVTSSAPVDTVSPSALNATATPTVWTLQMRHPVVSVFHRPLALLDCRRTFNRAASFQLHVFPTAPTAPPSCLSARTTFACSLTGNATATTTVETTQMRSFTSAVRIYLSIYLDLDVDLQLFYLLCLLIHSGRPV